MGDGGQYENRMALFRFHQGCLFQLVFRKPPPSYLRIPWGTKRKHRSRGETRREALDGKNRCFFLLLCFQFRGGRKGVARSLLPITPVAPAAQLASKAHRVCGIAPLPLDFWWEPRAAGGLCHPLRPVSSLPSFEPWLGWIMDLMLGCFAQGLGELPDSRRSSSPSNSQQLPWPCLRPPPLLAAFLF